MGRIRSAVAIVGVMLALASVLALGGCGDGVPDELSAEVPDVVGLSEPVARSLVAAAGLRVGEVTEDRSDPVPATGGAIVRDQSPRAGRTLELGEGVDLVIGGPLPPVTVPDVVQMELPDARRALERRGFVGEVQNPAAEDETAIVVGQFPAAGEDADYRSVVRLTVR